MNLKINVLALTLCLATGVQSQEADSLETRSSELEQTKDDSLQAQRNRWNESNTVYTPIIGVGAGIFNYFGEVNNNGNTNPLINNYGFQFNVIKNFSPSFALRFDVGYGKMTAIERSVESNRNFSTDVVNFNIQASYNFAGILRPGRFLNPFVSVGVGAVNFNSKGDLKAADGRAYNFWEDGTIRSLPENSPFSESADILRRDYEFETDLRKLDLDSLGMYPQWAVTIPFTFGLNFRVSPRSSIRLSSTLSYTFTDLIDNVTKEGSGVRRGNDMNDLFLFSSVSYHFDFFSPKKPKKKTPFDEMEFEEIDLEADTDGDGVKDLYDYCPETPSGAAVNERGCALDSDGDGVADPNDNEPNTPEGVNVNEFGEEITEDMLNMTRNDSLATIRAQMFEVYPELIAIYGPEEYRSSDKEDADERRRAALKELERSEFMEFDTDGNGVISVSEVYNAIDMFFDGEIQVDAAYINSLIDFFFDQ